VNNAVTVQTPTISISVTNVSTSFSPATQTVRLSASVSSITPSPLINQGDLVFTVTSATGKLIGTVTAPVINNEAVASFTIPAGQSAGTYTIRADFLGHSGFGTLTIKPAGPVVVVAPNITATFPNTDPIISLSASFTGDPPGFSVNGVPINEGQATLTISGLAFQPITIPVVNGQANFRFALPANSPVGVYTITITYSDPAGNYQSGTGTGKLTIVPSPSTVTINNVSILYGLMSEQETLSAVVRDPNGVVVNEGFVTFTEAGQTLAAPIVNGLATVTFTIPLMAENPFAHPISLAYSDSAGNFLSSTSMFIVEQSLFDFMLQMLAVMALMEANANNS
jgi:hypothetical protein